MKQKVYDLGDLVLKQGQNNEKIMILWEGTIQARVSRKDPDSNEFQDYWLDNLEKGACLAVYTSFIERQTSLVNFYASSKNCVMLQIDVNELMELCTNDIALQDRVKTV